MDIRTILSGHPWNQGCSATAIELDIGSRTSKGGLLEGNNIETALIATGVSMQKTADELITRLLRNPGWVQRYLPGATRKPPRAARATSETWRELHLPGRT